MSVAGGPWLWDGGGVQLQQQRLQTGQPCQPTRPPSTTTTTSSGTTYSQCRRDAMRWAGANVPYRVILALTYKQLQSCVGKTLFTKLCWLQTHVAAVRWEWRTVRHQKNDGGRIFFGFTQSAVHTDNLRPGLDGMSLAGKNGREKRL